MLYVYIVMWEVALDGTQFVYVSELFPNHLRAKGLSLALAAFCLVNIVWLQTAPTAFEYVYLTQALITMMTQNSYRSIGWRFYLVFIIPGAIGSVTMWLTFPDTRGMPLEEVAAIFGDRGELLPEATANAAIDSGLLDAKDTDTPKSASYNHIEKSTEA